MKYTLCLASLICGIYSASAVTTTYTLKDIGTFTDYSVDNTGQSFAGDGFIGMLSTVASGTPQLAHVFGVEHADYSRTAIQVNVSGLSGLTISSAYLSFVLKEGERGSQDLKVTSFTADGNLKYSWDAADSLGSLTHSVLGKSANIIDVTSLLQDRLDAGSDWLGLHLAGDSLYQYTSTFIGDGANSDSAQVRLTVNYNTTSRTVPEAGSTAVLTLIALGGLCLAHRRLVATA